MPIDFTQFERGQPFSGDFAATMAQLRQRVEDGQRAQIIHKKRAIILFEGWTGSGKKDALRQLSASLDPCHTSVHVFRREDLGEDDRHWFAPFWGALPGASETSLFIGSWYSRAVDTLAAGKVSGKLWTRMLDEINEFESQQRDHGSILIKLFFHVTEEEQLRRLDKRLADPWDRHTLSSEDLARAHERAKYMPILAELFDSSNMRWAPWTVIDAADPHAAQVAVMTQVAEQLEKHVPAEPPADAPSAEIINFQARRRG